MLSESVTLEPGCETRDVEIWVDDREERTQELALDCNGATLRGAKTPNSAAINVHSHEGGERVSNVTVRNCHIEGYERGIRVFVVLRALESASRTTARSS